MFKFLPPATLLYLICCQLGAQTVILTGRVTDKETEEGIPFANLAFKGSLRTGATDFDGYFRVEAPLLADSLVVSCVGYNKQAVPLNRQIKIQIIHFALSRAKYDKKQAAILKRSDAKAFIIMKKVVKNKRSHDRDKLNSYAYQAYTKIEIDLDELTPKFKNRKIFKPFNFIFNDIDSTSEVSPFLPFFITETVSDFHYKKSPFYPSREIIRASKVSGINDASITQFLGSTYVSVNIYDDLIKLLNRQFISPASALGFAAYNYFLTDSQVIDSFKCYKIRFFPKTRKQPLSLEGELWIADSVFAIKEVSMGMSPGSDVNLVRSMSLFNEFVPVKDSVWMLSKEKLTVHFLKPDNTPGLVARKAATYSHFVVNEKESLLDSLFNKESRDVTIRDSAAQRSDAYWEEARKGSPSFKENNIYTMIDTLSKMPIIKNYLNLLQTVFQGYTDFGPVSIGDIYDFLDYDNVEGWRPQFGMRTSKNFSKEFRFGGYVGYATLQKEAKYGGELLWLVNKDPWQYLWATYRNDVVWRPNYDNFYISTSDYFTSDILKRFEAGQFIPDKEVGIKELRLTYYKAFKSGYSLTAGFTNRYIQPLGDFNFSYVTSSDALHPNTTITSATTTEFNITQRFAWQENFLTTDFYRYSIGSKFPVLTLQYVIGIKQFMNGDFNYQKLIGNITDTRLLGPLGKLRWLVEAGRIYGNLPFFFLAMPDATETYFTAFNYFNTIQRYQYVADRYVKVMFDHHLDGFLFDRVPGFKKLKLREVWGYRMWWGDLSQTNSTSNYADLASNPANTGLIRLQVADKVPLIEMNAGVENILHFIRLDLVWRVTHLNPQGNRFSVRYGNFGPRASFEWQF